MLPRPFARAALLLGAVTPLAAVTFAASDADAAPPYVDRGLTLPSHDWSFDVGLGIAHDSAINPTLTGAGLNFELAVAPIENLELGFRVGVRLDNDAQALNADEAGRLFDRETFGGGAPLRDVNGDAVANPEFRVRGRVLHTRVVEIALEGRTYLPIEDGSRFGVLFGVPIAFHLGQKARIDTGAYTPVFFYDNPYYALDLPLNVWFQVTHKVWLGPMTGLRFESEDPNYHHTSASLGFGFGYQLARAVDMKAMLLSPNITDNEGVRAFQIGFGFQFRIE